MHGLSRRHVVLGGAAAALVSPGRLRAGPLAGFTHGVASGEPTASSVLLWTRYAAAGPVPLTVEVAREPGFARIVARGTALATPEADGTARATLTGLPPGTWLWYRWRAPDGTRSPTGRTRTLPEGRVDRFVLALFSCSNLGFGWFNAFAHAAARSDLDLAVHLGDYIYEYPLGTYPGPDDLVRGRDIAPDGALIALADYRQRYASYRRCPDLQALHARLPMLAVWDDHEFADDARVDGAWNHDPKTQGPWADRKAAAEQAWREWMPVSAPGHWASHRIGDLATLFALETRITGRTPSPGLYAAAKAGGDFAGFARDEWRDDRFRILGAPQERWLLEGLATSARATPWQLLLQSVPMGHTALPPAASGWTAAGGQEGADEVAMLVEAGRHGIAFNMDNWGGFPAQRSRILAAAQDVGANLIVTSGDSHNGWGYDLAQGGRTAGVELAVPSVTSPGFERWFPQTPPDRIAAALVESNPELVFADTHRRGYGTVELTPDRARLGWHFTGSPRQREKRLEGERFGLVRSGEVSLTF